METLPQEINEIIYFYYLDNNIFDDFYNNFREIRKYKYVNRKVYKQIKTIWKLVLEHFDYGNIIEKVYFHPVKYINIFKKLENMTFDYNTFINNIPYTKKLGKNKYYNMIIDEGIYYDVMKSMASSWDNIFYKDTELYVIGNDVGYIRGNFDYYYDMGLTTKDFRYGIVNNNGITLSNIVDGIFRMKGCKHDFYYELLYKVMIIKGENKLLMKVYFDHGT